MARHGVNTFPTLVPKSVHVFSVLWLLLNHFVAFTIQQEEMTSASASADTDDHYEYDVWEEGDLNDLYETLQCDQVRSKNKNEGDAVDADSDSGSDEELVPPVLLKVHSTDTWKFMQSTYHQVMVVQGKKTSSLPEGGFLGLDGFYVPYKVDHGPHGRGIFATKDIDEGTLIWKSFQTARFETGEEYRKYLRGLPPALACDVLHWAYTRMEAREDGYSYVVACVDLDPGSFVNECGTEWECNMEVTVPRASGCRLEFHAARDVEAGEELRVDYSFSEHSPGWATLGLHKGSVSVFGLEDYGEGDDEEEEEEEDAESTDGSDNFEYWPARSKQEL